MKCDAMMCSDRPTRTGLWAADGSNERVYYCLEHFLLKAHGIKDGTLEVIEYDYYANFWKEFNS